jgi:hypothetical protein
MIGIVDHAVVTGVSDAAQEKRLFDLGRAT